MAWGCAFLPALLALASWARDACWDACFPPGLNSGPVRGFDGEGRPGPGAGAENSASGLIAGLPGLWLGWPVLGLLAAGLADGMARRIAAGAGLVPVQVCRLGHGLGMGRIGQDRGYLRQQSKRQHHWPASLARETGLPYPVNKERAGE